MQNISKALQDLAQVLNNNDIVDRVKVTITLVKPKQKSSKAQKDKTIEK